jgi:fumarate reductase flavoprotein subunit
MRYFPYLYDDSMGSDGFRYTGDGIKIADEAGAVLEPWATMVREGGWCFGVGRGIPTRAASIPYAIAVNTRGERFKSEARGGPPPNAPSGGKRSGGGPPPGPMSSGPRAIDPVLRQPKKIMFALFDDKMIQRYEDEIAASVKAGNRNKFGSADVPEFRKFLKQQAMHSDYWVKIANNLNEIARYIGADPKVLKATVEEYNYYCYWGFDEAFLKPKEYLMPLHDPPYYAIRQITAMTETFGPLRVNEKMEVLNKDNKPIPGFYAAGAITSGFTAHDYGHGGYALGYCVNTGRIAAESAARSMKK